MTTRREFLAGAATLSAALGDIGRARAAEPMIIITPFGFDPNFIELMNAYSGGHFAREGLDAKVLGAPGSAQSLQQMVSGQVQFAMIASLDFIRAVGARDAPLQAFATLGQHYGFYIVSLNEKPIRRAADLSGKTIGILSVGGFTEVCLDLILAKDGVPKASVKRVVAGSSPGEVDLIRAGRLDAFICNFTTAFLLRRANAPVELLSFDDIAPAPGQIYYCRRDTIAEKPALVTATLRALKNSVLEIMHGPIGPIFARAARDFDIPRLKDLDLLAALEQTVIEQHWLARGRQNLLRNLPELWQGAVDQMHAAGIIPLADASGLYTNRFIDAVGNS